MANRQTINTASVGRYSSQMLQQFGAQKRIVTIGDFSKNTFDLAKGGELGLPPDSLQLGFNGELVTGSLKETEYSVVFAYFQSRSNSNSNAAAMALILIDAAKIQGVNSLALIDEAKRNNTNLFKQLYPVLNLLRTASDQQEITTEIANNKSLKSRYITP